ncbi:MAG: hypothetical protein KF724_02725 [Phycisphaeraceae bacterium]|nr:hypothetical protein [Phycisphaeraceae bacterium]
MSTPATAPARSWKVKLAAALVAAAFCLIVAEIVLQAYYWVGVGQPLWRRVSPGIYALNEHAGYWNKPLLSYHHQTHEFDVMLYTNEQGFRSSKAQAPVSYERTPGVERILLLGPSFAFGWGVNYEDTFAVFLANALSQAKGAPGSVEVINAGVPAQGPAAQLAWFRAEGEKYRPDIAMQFVYGSMVVPQKENWNKVELTADGAMVQRDAGLSQRLKGIAKNSALVFYGWIAVTNFQRMVASDGGSREITGAGRVMKRFREFDPNDPEIAEALAFYREQREAMSARGVRQVIVHFPLAYMVHPEDRARWSHQGVLDTEEELRFNEAFCQALAAEGFEVINITQDLIDAVPQGRLYFPVDIHWTPLGNRVAAEATAAKLLSGPARGSAGAAAGSGAP